MRWPQRSQFFPSPSRRCWQLEQRETARLAEQRVGQVGEVLPGSLLFLALDVHGLARAGSAQLLLALLGFELRSLLHNLLGFQQQEAGLVAIDQRDGVAAAGLLPGEQRRHSEAVSHHDALAEVAGHIVFAPELFAPAGEDRLGAAMVSLRGGDGFHHALQIGPVRGACAGRGRELPLDFAPGHGRLFALGQLSGGGCLKVHRQRIAFPAPKTCQFAELLCTDLACGSQSTPRWSIVC